MQRTSKTPHGGEVQVGRVWGNLVESIISLGRSGHKMTKQHSGYVINNLKKCVPVAYSGSCKTLYLCLHECSCILKNAFNKKENVISYSMIRLPL